AYRVLFESTFGPLIAIRASVANDPARARALERDFRDFTSRRNAGPPSGPAEYPYEYLLVIARRGGE
ncbi:MAG: SAM-dependent methyltransferase, partial [Gemmatimonadaceae bacterium]